MTDIPKLTPTPKSELAVKELEELLNHLAAESLHTARSIANLKAQLDQLTVRSEQQWEQVQQLRKELETRIK